MDQQNQSRNLGQSAGRFAGQVSKEFRSKSYVYISAIIAAILIVIITSIIVPDFDGKGWRMFWIFVLSLIVIGGVSWIGGRYACSSNQFSIPRPTELSEQLY